MALLGLRLHLAFQVASKLLLLSELCSQLLHEIFEIILQALVESIVESYQVGSSNVNVLPSR